MGLEVAIIFPSLMQHTDILPHMPSGDIVSAGFVRFGVSDTSPKAYCYGKSVSLQKESREQDSDIVEQTLRIGKYDRD